ncbi:hypothetical protein [Noviherbaspirillum sp. UKPF54]|uniref:hypothetical protein n=1 Tax=Noviherbaspirillum sp. UKPF54 TaxID=2601898 RepID=UPI0011B1577E|nr:hypothetical protein [Noviherbaspirillum sp. UKPF54]QDZ26601.1 hypothetical protein FAY22_00625 [Noviherbaspirillum sp. UKPF54]
MQELKPLQERRFLIRNKKTNEALAIIEAETLEQALQRSRKLVDATTLLGNITEFEGEQVHMPMPLPTFLDGYFSLLDQ